MLVKWAGVTAAGSSTSQPVIIEDIFPSVLEMAGVYGDVTQEIDGVSFLPLLKQEKYKAEDRMLVWHNPHRWIKDSGPGINFFSAARKGKWKLIYDYRNQKLELYDLSRDISESDNVISKHKKVARSLAGQLTEKLKSWQARMPVYQASGTPVLWPDALQIP